MNEPTQGGFADLLPRMQQIAASHAGVRVWAHPGQLAWSSIFTDPAAPAVVIDETAYAWFDGPGWLEVGGDPAVAKILLSWAFERSKTVRLDADPDWLDALTTLGGVEQEAPWFTLQRLCLSSLGAPELHPGYTVRHVEHGEADARSAAHRAAWSDNTPSAVSGDRYARLAAFRPRSTARSVLPTWPGPGICASPVRDLLRQRGYGRHQGRTALPRSSGAHPAPGRSILLAHTRQLGFPILAPICHLNRENASASVDGSW